MTKDEALKMAIETLEAFEITGYCDETIRACKEALEQPAYETESWKNNMKEAEEILAKAKFANEQPAQEPVAWMYQTEDENFKTDTLSVGYEPTFDGKIIPLYTHPAPQPAQEPCVNKDEPKKCWRVRCHLGKECVDDELSFRKQPSQEPVGEYLGACWDGDLIQLYDDLKKGTKLYTHPAPSWQGLSDDEINDLWDEYGGNWRAFSRAIGQALKEKNYG